MEIKELSLLTVEEYAQHKFKIAYHDDAWWLKPKFGDNELCFVNEYGSPVSLTPLACARDYGVRPTMRIALDLYDPEYWRTTHSLIYKRFLYQDISWTVLSFDDANKELVALCDEFLDYLPMDTTFTGWDTSELKNWLETVAFKKLA